MIFIGKCSKIDRMKIIMLILLLLAVIAGGMYVSRNTPKIDVANYMPFSQVSPVKKTDKNKVNPSKTCSGVALPAATEGPYYKAGSSERTKIDNGAEGTKLYLTGFVLDTNCVPVANAWLDFWQADSQGKYDNSGYKLRGHQFTDSEGKYSLTTIIPGEYPGRTPHIHAKVRARENSPVLTVQLFIPGLDKNLSDGIYNGALLMDIKDSENGKTGEFNFIINKDL